MENIVKGFFFPKKALDLDNFIQKLQEAKNPKYYLLFKLFQGIEKREFSKFFFFFKDVNINLTSYLSETAGKKLYNYPSEYMKKIQK